MEWYFVKHKSNFNLNLKDWVNSKNLEESALRKEKFGPSYICLSSIYYDKYSVIWLFLGYLTTVFQL
jgi:hypothetical protein